MSGTTVRIRSACFGCLPLRPWPLILLLVLGISLAERQVHGQFSEPSQLRQPSHPVSATSHPSVARVRVKGVDSESLGSGTLIGATEEHGYVITNWHVVREAQGQVLVEFPDGFQSAATILKTDETWDLGLLLIWRPTAIPMPLSPNPPKPGDALIIAGYGQGSFRAVQGVFADYASPTADAPMDMFEVTVAARQGDSGGPIVNARGELAGVLFGAGDGRTTGTQVHRVREFLDSAFLPGGPIVSSSSLLADRGAAGSVLSEPSSPSETARQATSLQVDAQPAGGDALASQANRLDDYVAAIPREFPQDTRFASATTEIHADDLLGQTTFDKAKSILAIIGLISLVIRFLPR